MPRGATRGALGRPSLIPGFARVHLGQSNRSFSPGALDSTLGAGLRILLMSDLIPIGQFAALSSLSPKALRIYQDQGLLAPAVIDEKTGYRYYSADQLPDASRIALMRRAGITLTEIAAFLADPSVERLSRWQTELEEQHLLPSRLLGQLISQTQERKAPTVTSKADGQLKRGIPILASLDLEATQRFYSERFGFTARSNYPDYAIVERDEVEIHFWLTDDPAIPKQTACYVRVTGIDSLYAEYLAKGVVHPNGPLTDKPSGQREFGVLDGDGNLIRFGERTIS